MLEPFGRSASLLEPGELAEFGRHVKKRFAEIGREFPVLKERFRLFFE